MKNDKWNAEEYSQHSSAQETWADELIGKLNLTKNESGLDIGCGDGRITSKISKILTNGFMVGIDFSHSMIGLANQQYAAENLAFYEMCATKIDIEKTFDFAFSNAALHWVEDQKAVLTGLRKHLNKNARILFQMGGHGNAQGIIDAFDIVINRNEWSAQFRGFQFPYSFRDAEYYSELLKECGYQPKRVELIKKIMNHDSPHHLKGWLKTTWFPYTDRINTENREQFLDQVLQTYLSKNPLNIDGTTSVGMVRLEVEAVVQL